MDWKIRKLQGKQLDRLLSPLGKLSCPKDGWVKTIRLTLGMTSKQLGKRIGVSSPRILKIEQDEVQERTTLATLKKLANVMDCEFVYGFVPRESLVSNIEKQALKKAKEQISRVSHTMALEDQRVEEKIKNEHIKILKEELLTKNIKRIWEDDEI